MKKIVFSCAVISLLSSDVFAWEIYKGHLINEKKWTTSNNVQLTFNNLSAEEHSFSLKRKQGSDIAQNNVESEIYDSKGFVNALTPVKGHHLVRIENNTDEKQIYSYLADLCINTRPKREYCASYGAKIELEPHGYAELEESPTMQIVFEKPGTYEPWMRAILELKDNTSTLTTSSSNNIEIS